jgi:hypothetical protein
MNYRKGFCGHGTRAPHICCATDTKKASIIDFNSSMPPTSQINLVWSDMTVDTKTFIVTKERMQIKESLNKMQITSVVSLEKT